MADSRDTDDRLPTAHLAADDGTCGCSPNAAVLLKSQASWNGKPYDSYPQGRPQLTILRFSIPPRTSLPWHTHPVPNAGYILSGEITLEERATGHKRILRAGEAFAESVDDVHRGYTGEEPAEIICTYAGVEGLPLSVPSD